MIMCVVCPSDNIRAAARPPTAAVVNDNLTSLTARQARLVQVYTYAY